MASPEFQMVLDRLKDRPISRGVQPLRERMDSIGDAFAPPDDVVITPGEANGVPMELLTPPAGTSRRTVLYLHGGGYMAGSLKSTRHLVGHLAKDCAVNVLNVDYRLAPEHPFPAAVEDALAAYRWLLDQGRDSEAIAIAGDSAGGGLALSLGHAIRQEGLDSPGAVVALSPVTDFTLSGESYQTNRETDVMVDQTLEEDSRMHYLNGQDPENPLASPLFGDFAGYPPLLLQVSKVEILYSDAERVAEKARAAGVDVTFSPYDEMVHVWQYFIAFLPEAQQAMAEIRDFLTQKLAGA